MSALAVALAAFDSSSPQQPQQPPPLHVPRDAAIVHPQPSPSRSSSPLSIPSLTNSSSSSSSSIEPSPPSLRLSTSFTRPNEHLAVLLPKHLWKPDGLASRCDNFYCRVRFSMFERRHHCRKCGGVFCGACSSRTTELLDTSNLDVFQPPRNVPISAFESPTSPIFTSRVCDDCWDQLHGYPTTPRTPELLRPTLKRAFSHPISLIKYPLSRSPTPSGESSLSSSVVSTPPNPPTLIAPSITRRASSLRTTPSISSLDTYVSVQSTPSQPRRSTMRTSHLPLPLDLERSYGELDAYPLRRSSVLCKATGGGRWEPKQSPVMVGYRLPVPGGKAPYEVEMEREEEAERLRRENPVIKDGAFQYRFPKQPEHISIARSPLHLSTF